jgi:hypothetical protein
MLSDDRISPEVWSPGHGEPEQPDGQAAEVAGEGGWREAVVQAHPRRPAEGARFKGDDGKTVTAPLTKKGDRCRVASPVWYGQYLDADGVLRRMPLCEW